MFKGCSNKNSVCSFDRALKNVHYFCLQIFMSHLFRKISYRIIINGDFGDFRSRISHIKLINIATTHIVTGETNCGYKLML